MLADHFGGYSWGFTVLAALAGAGSVLFLLARRPPPPARLRRASGARTATV